MAEIRSSSHFNSSMDSFFFHKYKNLFFHRKRENRTRRGKREKALSILRTQEKPQMKLPANTESVPLISSERQSGIRDICISVGCTFYSTGKGGLQYVPSDSGS